MRSHGRQGKARAPIALIVLVSTLALPGVAHAAINVSDASVTEGNAPVTEIFTVTRDAGLLAGKVTVDFNTTNGTATAPADYVATSGSLTFPATLLPATQVEQVAVTIVGDRLDENNETFSLIVGGPEVANGLGTGTIIDDDPTPSVALAAGPTVSENAGPATFTVGLSAPSGRDVSVAFATADGSATAPGDYITTTGRVTIPAGATSRPVSVPIVDDSAVEGQETFDLRLSAPTNATLGSAGATATIVDNDVPPPPPAPTSGSSGTPTATPGSTAPAGTLPKLPTTTVAPVVVKTPTSSSGSAPRIGVSAPRLRLPSTVLVTISCPSDAGTCKGQVTIFSRPNRKSRIKALHTERNLGKVAISLGGGKSTTYQIKLGKINRSLIQRAGRVKVRAFAVVRNGAGVSGVRTVSGTLIARTVHG